jgi:hypothetical protein
MNQFRILGASPDESKERVKRISNGYPIEQIDQSHAGLANFTQCPMITKDAKCSGPVSFRS